MSVKTTFSRIDIDAALQRLLDEYTSLANCDREIFYVEKDKLSICTKYQSIFRLKFDDSLMTALHHQCMTYLLRAEMAGPGSFDVTLRDIILRKTRTPTSDIMKCSLAPSRSHILKLIESYVPETLYGSLNSMIVDALDLAGFGGKIAIEQTFGPSHVEHVAGYNFKLTPGIQIKQKTTLQDVRVLCLDGHIEDVAMAHHLFEQVVDSKQPCLLFLREVSNDVRETIRVNYDRGVMKLIPIPVTFDLETANTLVDVATVSGGDVISRTQGAVISQIKLLDHPVVEKVDIFPNSLTIFNRKTQRSVAVHLKNVQIKRDATVPELQHTLDGRVASLLSNTTVIRLKKDTGYVFKSQLIDFVLRSIKHALSYGVDILEDGSVRPASLDVIANVFTQRLQASLDNLGAVVT